jgi:hypothetical protein
MAALLLLLGILMVVNHRTGWLASRVMNAPRHHERTPGYDARRMMLDADERPADLFQSSSSGE